VFMKVSVGSTGEAIREWAQGSGGEGGALSPGFSPRGIVRKCDTHDSTALYFHIVISSYLLPSPRPSEDGDEEEEATFSPIHPASSLP
jgi:hypothetical protein